MATSALLLIVSLGCGEEERFTSGASGAMAFRLSTQRALWKAEGPFFYRIRVIQTCECPDLPTRFAYTNFRQVPGFPPIPEPPDHWGRERVMSVIDLFDFIEASMTGGEFAGERITPITKADEITVTYDEELGYPRLIVIDYNADIVGDEVMLDIWRFIDNTP
jgi:hypothetical protein